MPSIKASKKEKAEYARSYRKRNREKVRAYNREYNRRWREKHKSSYYVKYYNLNKDKILSNNKSRYKTDKVYKEAMKKATNSSRKKVRLDALLIVGRGVLKCVNCGIGDIDMLQINHINGDGNKDKRAKLTGWTMMYAIRNGKRVIDDLNLLCSPCNWAHWLNIEYSDTHIVNVALKD